MLQLQNKTPFAAGLTALYDRHGVETLYIMASATFNISRKWTLVDEQIPPRGEDEYWGEDPASSSIKYASDYHIGKPYTDIVLIGQAHAPEGRKVSQLDVSLQVGQVSKAVRVFGEREWQNGSMSPAQGFASIPLVYERAFGGMHCEGGEVISAEVRNLIGCGYLGKRKAKVLDGTPVPNLEDPRHLLTKAGDVVPPAGFGFISPGWQPRLQYAGTYDEAWQTRRAPYLPEDFDPRFLNMAHPDLIYPGYLYGGEPVQVQGAHPLGTLQFNIPVIGLYAKVLMDKKTEEPSFNLETVIIEPDGMRLTLTWRAALRCDKKLLKAREIIINLAQPRRQVA